MAINLSLGNANRIYYWLVTLNALIFCTSIIRNRLELIIRDKSINLLAKLGQISPNYQKKRST
jgi:hypothetical protein